MTYVNFVYVWCELGKVGIIATVAEIKPEVHACVLLGFVENVLMFLCYRGFCGVSASKFLTYIYLMKFYDVIFSKRNFLLIFLILKKKNYIGSYVIIEDDILNIIFEW